VKLEAELLELGIPLSILKNWKTYICQKSSLVGRIIKEHEIIMKLHQCGKNEAAENYFFVFSRAL